MANWVVLKRAHATGSMGDVRVNLDAAFTIVQGYAEDVVGGGSIISMGPNAITVENSVDEVFAMAKKGQTP